jgi:heptosyltransferase II
VFKASPVFAALAFLSGAPVRAGLARSGGARLLTAPVAVRADEHREDRFLRVAAALGAGGAPPAASARWPGDNTGLCALRPEQRAFLIGIAPGGARNVKEEMPERRWPLDRYAELASRLLARYQRAHLVILGGPDDRADAEAVARRLPAERVTNLAGKTTVAAAREVIAACRLFVTHDSGLLHVAGGTETPLVAIFGPTSPHVVCARRPLVCAVWHPARPEPCHDEVTGALAPCVRPCCIDRCSVDEVFEQASALLQPTLDLAEGSV